LRARTFTMSETTCPLISSFMARQGIIAIAGTIFFTFTFIRKMMGAETRDLRTFAADVSKQGFQQGFGGALMAVVGVALEHMGGFDALAWYGAEYPFEIIITTYMTRVFRLVSEKLARSCNWTPMLNMGSYSPEEGQFWCSWYLVQLVQAVLLIGVPARLVSVGFILSSTMLPEEYSPVRFLAAAYYNSGLTCLMRTTAILYAVPLVGDAVQFVVIDLIQKARVRKVSDAHLVMT